MARSRGSTACSGPAMASSSRRRSATASLPDPTLGSLTPGLASAPADDSFVTGD